MINSVGCAACRPKFQEALLAALGDDLPKLCQDCQRRAKTNPLRIYDCKVEADQPIIDRLPHSVDYLCEACATHFSAVQRQLTDWSIPWRISHRLVRGLDYYTRTTFEILGHSLGAQNALLGGGRYDGLVKDLGGPDRTGIGFAAGLERLVLALPDDAPIAVDAAGLRRGHWRRRPRGGAAAAARAAAGGAAGADGARGARRARPDEARRPAGRARHADRRAATSSRAVK